MGEMVVTRWSPDTCGCVIEYEWERDSDPDTRVHSHTSSPVVCPAHAGMSGPHESVGGDVGPPHFAQVLRENRAKNQIHGWVLDNVPHARQVVVGGGLGLADDVAYDWSFSGQGRQRHLTVEFAGASLTPQQKAQLQQVASSHSVPSTVL